MRFGAVRECDVIGDGPSNCVLELLGMIFVCTHSLNRFWCLDDLHPRQRDNLYSHPHRL